MVWTTAEIYESLAFTDQAGSGQRISVKWVATAFGGKQLRGSTILVTNEEGKIDHAVVQRRPLDGLLASSAELGKRMSGVNADRRVSSLLIQSENPLPATRHVRGRRGGLRSKQAASGTSYAQALKAVFPGAL